MKHYLDATRSPWYSYLFALPLLLLYQVTAVLANLGERHAVINGADALLHNLLSAVGLRGWLGSWLAVAAVAGVLVYRADALHRGQKLRTGYFGGMLLESAIYALFFGTIVATLTALILPFGGYLQAGMGGVHFGQKLATSLGAGLYEELFFRVLMMGGLIGGLRLYGWTEGKAVGAAVLLSSLIFSGFHYVGAYADAFTLGSFTFRFIAGVLLAALFRARGFAVVAWTHALYDVFLLFAGRA